jgi:hypothetical protein
MLCRRQGGIEDRPDVRDRITAGRQQDRLVRDEGGAAAFAEGSVGIHRVGGEGVAGKSETSRGCDGGH